MTAKWVSAARGAHTRALAAAQMFPLTGDGEHTGAVLGRLTASDLPGADTGGGYAPELAAARYRDWLAATRAGAVATRVTVAGDPAPVLTLRPEAPGAVQTRINLPARQHRAPPGDLRRANALLRELVEEFGALFPEETAAAAAYLQALE